MWRKKHYSQNGHGKTENVEEMNIKQVYEIDFSNCAP